MSEGALREDRLLDFFNAFLLGAGKLFWASPCLKPGATASLILLVFFFDPCAERDQDISATIKPRRWQMSESFTVNPFEVSGFLLSGTEVKILGACGFRVETELQEGNEVHFLYGGRRPPGLNMAEDIEKSLSEEEKKLYGGKEDPWVEVLKNVIARSKGTDKPISFFVIEGLDLLNGVGGYACFITKEKEVWHSIEMWVAMMEKKLEEGSL